MILDPEKFPIINSINSIIEKEAKVDNSRKYVARKIQQVNYNINEVLKSNLSKQGKLSFLRLQKKEAVNGLPSSAISEILRLHMNNLISTLYKIAYKEVTNKVFVILEPDNPKHPWNWKKTSEEM